MDMDIGGMLDCFLMERQSQLLADICQLVKIDSSRSDPLPGKPFGEGAAHVLKEALAIAKDKGFSVCLLNDCIGIVEMDGAEEGLDILSHLDVMPGGDGWTVTQPFSPVILDNRLYGRGAADNKGPSIGVLYALEAVRSLGIPFKRQVRILWGTAEETGSEDLKLYYSNHNPAPMTVSPDASFPVITAEKGRFVGRLSAPYIPGKIEKIQCRGPSNGVPTMAEAVLSGRCGQRLELMQMKYDHIRWEWEESEERTEIRVFGRSAHGAAPWSGANALTVLLCLSARFSGVQKVLTELAKAFPHGDYYGNALGIAQEEPISGPLTISLNNLLWSKEEGLAAVFDCRLPVHATKQSVVAPIRQYMNRIQIKMEGDFLPPHVVSEDSFFVRTLLDCWKECSGQEAKPKAIAGNTYAHGIPGAVAFGFADPVLRTGTHGPDEYAETNQLMLGTRIYARMIYKLCVAAAEETSPMSLTSMDTIPFLFREHSVNT